jgi:hypothetical protein
MTLAIKTAWSNSLYKKRDIRPLTINKEQTNYLSAQADARVSTPSFLFDNYDRVTVNRTDLKS